MEGSGGQKKKPRRFPGGLLRSAVALQRPQLLLECWGHVLRGRRGQRHWSRSASALARAEATTGVGEARLGRSRTRTKVGATCEAGNGHYCSNSESNRFHYRSPPNRFLLLLASKQSRIHWVRDSLATEKCMVVHFFGNLFPVLHKFIIFRGMRVLHEPLLLAVRRVRAGTQALRSWVLMGHRDVGRDGSCRPKGLRAPARQERYALTSFSSLPRLGIDLRLWPRCFWR